jgi:hypothetical protein
MILFCYRRGQYEDSCMRLHIRLSGVFDRVGVEVFDASTPPAGGTSYRRELEKYVGRSDVVVVVIAPDWLEAINPASGAQSHDLLVATLESALSANKAIIPVLVDGATMPTVEQLPPALRGIALLRPFEIPSPGAETALQALVHELHRSTGPVPPPSAAPTGAAASEGPSRSYEDLDRLFGEAHSPPAPTAALPSRATTPKGPTPAAPMKARGAHSPPAPAAPSGQPKRPGMLANVLNAFRTLWSRKPAERVSEHQVLLAASAPRSSCAGAEFAAALVAYVEEARASARKKLADLGEPGDRLVDDVPANTWRTGAPVTVRLTCEGATISPPEVRFDWSGRENLAAFSVKVGSAQRDAVLLSFQISVANVLVAFLPMRVNLGASPETDATHRVQGALPRSAFASYSSRDAEPVTQRLSTLLRWAPGLDIFQDCLDLTPGERFKPQLERQIARRDVFMLFWSRQAALSPWVRWEYTTALQQKGVGGILPMPLEDPAIAPPPPELADQHLRDRFMLAGYGLAKVREEAAGGRNT